MKSISVVIPNYNGRQLLEKNLPSVYSALRSSHISDYEIIVSDDCSKDDSCEYLRTSYPDIRVIKGGKNLGFGGNINRGIFKSSKDLILLLNSDVTLMKEYFIPCLSYFNNPQTFGVMGSIRSPDGNLQDAAKYPEIVGLKIKGTINYKPVSNSSKQIPTFFLSGANALIDREKILQLDGFDEIYNPYYGEDLDLGLRAWKNGYYCYFESKAICIHPVSETIRQEQKKKVDIVCRRNNFFVHYIHLDTFHLSLWIISSVIQLVPRVLLFDFRYLKSFELFLLRIKEATTSRIKLEKVAQLKLGEVKKRILSMIRHEEIIKF